MAEAEAFDVIVIGAGQAGGPLAQAFAKKGRNVAIIEREHVGGTCVNEGCTPTKTMIASARVAYLARRSADYGVHTGSVRVNLEEVRARKREIVEDFRSSGHKGLVEADHVKLLMGEASFTDKTTVEVALNEGGSRTLTAPTIILNTGARPQQPPIKGLEQVRWLDSTTVMELAEVPEHLIVLGGGYIGLEFGQMFRRFGSEVTIVQRDGQLLGREDKDVADEVATILRDDGIRILLKADATEVEEADGRLHLRVKTAEGEETVTGSHLLVAAGRVPNTDRLNLPAAGVETDKRGFICTNDRLETSVPGIYALGDVKGGPAFTHISYDDFRIARANLVEGDEQSIEGRPVPYTVFIDPQLGRVGISEQEARERGRPFRVAKLPMSSVARAIETGETRGFMKAIVDGESDQILGCAILGLEGGEIMSVIQVAMMGKLPYTALRDGVFAHPTLAESLNNLFTQLEESPKEANPSSTTEQE